MPRHSCWKGRCRAGATSEVVTHMYCFRVRRRSSSSRISKSRHVLEMKTPCAGLEVDMKLRTFRDVCTTKQLLNEQTEQARALNSIRLLQESILCPEDSEEDDYATSTQCRRPASPDEYSLAIDYTAAKMVNAVIDKCKLFQCVSSLYKEESHELQSTLVGLHKTLQSIVGCPCLNKFQEALEDIMLYSTKAYAYLEKLCCTAAPSSSHGVHKAAAKINEFACRFYNLTVQFCQDSEQSWNHGLRCASTPREERLSFGVTTYTVPMHDVAERLLKKKRVHIPLTDLEGTSEYNVELSCRRSSQWFSKSVAMSAKVESHDRGFSQTLHADRVKMEKGNWGWEEALDTVLLTYDDLVVAKCGVRDGQPAHVQQAVHVLAEGVHRTEIPDRHPDCGVEQNRRRLAELVYQRREGPRPRLLQVLRQQHRLGGSAGHLPLPTEGVPQGQPGLAAHRVPRQPTWSSPCSRLHLLLPWFHRCCVSRQLCCHFTLLSVESNSPAV